jgi:hypothetical protein
MENPKKDSTSPGKTLLNNDNWIPQENPAQNSGVHAC